MEIKSFTADPRPAGYGTATASYTENDVAADRFRTRVVTWYTLAREYEGVTAEAADLFFREWGFRPQHNQISYVLHVID